jgi:hypothetical protein
MSIIAIIGVGNVGRAIAGRAVRAGHEVNVSARTLEGAAVAAEATGARAAASSADAVAGADIVILAVPGSALEEIATELGERLAGKVVVDVTNRPTPDLSDLAADPTSPAERLQGLLPEARIVKAFNTAFATRMANPVIEGVAIDGFVAGDDADAKAAILELVRELGFRPVDAGPLPNARALEALAWLNIYLNMTHGWSWQSGWKLVEPVPVAA